MKIELKEEFYANFLGYDKSTMDEVVSNLEECELKQLIKYWGKDSKKEIKYTAKKLILKIKKELFKKHIIKFELKEEFYANFVGYDRTIIDEIVSNLPKSELKQLIKYWGKDSTKEIRDTAKRLISKIKKELNKKYKMDIYKKYSSYINKKKLAKIIASLTLKELETLKKEYTINGKVELKEPLTKKEKHAVSNVILKLENKINNYCSDIVIKIDNRKYKSFFLLFPGYSKEEILLVVHHLEEKDYKLLTKKYGKDLTNTKYVPSLTKEENDDINTRILLNIRRRLKRIREGANYYTISKLLNIDINLIKERMNLLNEKDREKVYKIFGEKLDKEVLINPKHISTIIPKSAIKKLTLGKVKISHKNIVPFYQRLIKFKRENENMEEFKKRVNSCIESKYLGTLTKKYGPDLMAETNNGLYTSDDTKEINVLIIPMIEYKLKRLESAKTLIEHFASFVTIEDLHEGLNKLSANELNRLINEFGPDFDKKRSPLDYTKVENIKTFKTICKLESIIYNIIGLRIKIDKKEIKSAKVLRDIKSLIFTNEYKYISSIYTPNEALAIMIKLNIDINNESISLLTNVEESKITELTIFYLEEQSWLIQNNQTRLFKAN